MSKQKKENSKVHTSKFEPVYYDRISEKAERIFTLTDKIDNDATGLSHEVELINQCNSIKRAVNNILNTVEEK